MCVCVYVCTYNLYPVDTTMSEGESRFLWSVNRNTVQCLLKVMGVEEADRWLKPEMEGFKAMLQVKHHPVEALRKMVTDWLETWTAKWKVTMRWDYVGYSLPFYKLSHNILSVVMCSSNVMIWGGEIGGLYIKLSTQQPTHI